MTLLGIASDLLYLADLPGEEVKTVSSDEVLTWPVGSLDVLAAVGLATSAGVRSRHTCTECDEPHSETIRYAASGEQESAFIYCPSQGRVFIDAGDLLNHTLAATGVADALAASLGTGRPPQTLLAGRHWALGTVLTPTLQDLHLLRGLNWPDGEARFGHLTANPRSLLLTLAEQIPSWLAGPRVLPVASLLVQEGAGIAIALPDLGSVPTPISPSDLCGLKRLGAYWDVSWQGSKRTIRDQVGLIYLSHLLRAPGVELGALELLGLAAERSAPAVYEANALSISQAGSTEDVIDAEARRSYQTRIGELDAKKRSVGTDPSEDEELQYLRRELGRLTSLSGRPRRVSGPTERARSNVSQAIRRAERAIGAELPDMAAHLRAFIKRGAVFSYEPLTSVPWRIKL